MKKKHLYKIIFLTMAMFFAITISKSVSAREMTVEELGKELNKIEETSKQNIDSYYVIGEHIFTSRYKLDTRDIMFAARSIERKKNDEINTNNKDEILKEMTIHRVQRDFSTDNKWNILSNYVGDTQLTAQTKLSIHYIDYDYVYEEVNTDNLLKESEKKITSNNRYTVKFDENTGKITFTVLDKNEKISEDEIAEIIGSILKEKYVSSVTIGNVTISKDEAAQEGAETSIWNKVKEALKTLAPEENPENITLGELVGKTLDLTINMDEKVARSHKGNKSEKYTVEFTYNAPATISQEVSENDTAELKSKFGYEKEQEDTYTISGSDGVYTVTGDVIEKTEIKGFGQNEKTTYYFAYTVKLNDGVDSTKAKLKIPVKDSPNDNEYNVADFGNQKSITVLMEVEEDETTKYRDIIVEVDGVPTKIRIDFSSLNLRKNSKFTVTKEIPTTAAESIKTAFKNMGFEPEKISNFEDYKNGLTITEKDKNTVEVSGLLPLMKMTKANGFGEESTKTDGYYLVYVIKTDKKAKNGENGTDVKVKIPKDEKESMEPTKVITKDSFDTDNEIAILMKLNPNLDQFKVIVDMDGDSDKYLPYEIIVDYTKLDFQSLTTAEITIDGTNASETDKTQLTNWGYKFPNDITLSEENTSHKDKLSYDSETGLLTGAIKEQKLTGGFAKNELDSYFYNFTIKPDNITENIKVKIEDGNGTEKEAKYSDFSDGTLTILQHIPLNVEECSDCDCCTESGKCTNAQDCKCKKTLKITIDNDGDTERKYKEQVYYIDYCNVDFVKLHTVTFNDYNKDGELEKEVYDGEKVEKPENPVKEQHELDDNQYNTFYHWSSNKDGEPEEYKFTEDGESENTVTEDVTLNPIWEVDVDKYLTDAITHINEKSDGKFKVEGTPSDGSLKIDIEERDTKIADIQDTAIASTLAHALVSGEVSSIDLEMNKQTLSLKLETIKEELSKNDENVTEQEVKGQVATDIQKFIKEKVLDNQENKTLNDLYDKCHEQEIELGIFPNKSNAKFKGVSEQAGKTYNISLEKELIISYEAGALENPQNEYIKTNGSIEKLPTPEMTDKEKEYRKFDGWYKEGEKVEKLTNITTDTALTAHYTLNVDKFVEEVVEDLNSTDTTYSNDFSGKFNLTQDEANKNEITINIDSPKVELKQLAETSIPGTIAYILERGEIKDITLTVGGQSKEFTSEYTADGDKSYDQETGKGLLTSEGENLRKEIVKGAKKAFDDELSNQEDTATLDQLEYNNKEFKIKIGSPKDETVKLVKDDGTELSEDTDKTYTFKFDSDFAVVKQNDGNGLGATKIEDVIAKEDKDYSTIYIDGNYTTENPISVSTDNEINIKPVTDGINTVSTDAPTTEIKVNGSDKETVIDVQSGTVTISDLKLTGGKNSELKVEKGATVTANNIDVSGIDKGTFTDDQTDYNAGIIVSGGTLTASNIKNEGESYDVPAIRIPRKDYNGVVDGTVKITGTSMTKTNNYYAVTKQHATTDKHVTVYDNCYYTQEKNSKIYCVTFFDPIVRAEEGLALAMVKWYYSGEKIDNSEIEEFRKSVEEKYPDKMKEYTFKHWYVNEDAKESLGTIPKTRQVDNFDDEVLSKDIMYYAAYSKNPVANVVLQNSESGITADGNNISGTIKTQSDGKFYIPITLTSDKFKDNISTVKVTNPNGEVQNYKYNQESENGIATVSADETKKMNLNLEAIKTNQITGKNGKQYEITVDVDGDGEEAAETYTVNYDNVKTAEELINEAAQNTQEATSLTIEKDNKIKGGVEKYKFEIDRESKTKLYTEGENESKIEQYSFPRESVNAGNDIKEYIVVEKSEKINKETDRPKLNEWTYFNQFDAVSDGTHELVLLKDIIKKDESGNIDKANSIYALTKVEKKDGQEHTYTVTVSKEKISNWLNLTYLDQNNEKTTMQDGTSNENGTVQLEVTLDDQDKYVTGLKTIQNFTIVKEDGTYNDNKIDVKFTAIGSTTVKTPQQMLRKSESEEATNEEIQQFIQKGKEWWNKKTGSESSKS